jgi:TonB-linked SusC/RagA family outer membrane protein
MKLKHVKYSLLTVLLGISFAEASAYDATGIISLHSYLFSTEVSGTSDIARKISGTIKDSGGSPLIGVSVIQKGTENGVASDLDGRFTISVPDGSILIISSIGYKTVEIAASDEMIVVLKEDSKMLEEVVVVGYGTQKKANLTGAVDQVSSDVFEGRPNSNVTQMLQGSIPNLNLKLTDGKPTSSATYNIRGTTSIGQGGSALVLIDGVEGNPALLNPDDIESVSVLKDAASSSIYGSRAPYGVVLITTKSAKIGKARVTYSTNFSIEQPTNTVDYVSDGYTWAEHFYTAYHNYNHSNPSGINKSQQFSTAWLAEYKSRAESGNYGTVISDGSWGTTKGRWVYFNKGTDYAGMIYKNHFLAQTHNLSVSGSDGKFDYYLSGRFYGYGGLFDSPHNTDDYKAINTRLKAGYQVYKWLKIVDNIDISYNKYYNPVTYSEGNGNVWRNLADEGHPSSPIWNPDGTMSYSAVYSVGDFLYGNSRHMTVNDYVKNTISATAKFFDDKLHINADFTYRDATYNRQIKRVRTPYSKIAGTTETISGTQSYISETNKDTKYINTNVYAEYTDKFMDVHNVKFLIGYNYEQSTMKQLYAYNDDLLTENVDNINLTTGTDNRNITGAWTKWRSVGAFFRVNYNYSERYLLEVNGRYDGSSKFLEGSRWSFFPSISAGWRLTQEPWLNVNDDILSNLKIRASYGALGNSNISAYSFDEKFSMGTGRYFNGTKVKTVSPSSPIPDNLTWETARTLDVGLDFGLFRDRFSVTADWYNRKTINMYIVGPTLPDVYGAYSPKGNYGEMTTRGYEITATWRDSFNLTGKKFNYSIRATLADYKSVIDKYNNSTKNLGTSNSPSYYKGMTIGEIWGFTSNGLWQTQEDIDAAEAAAKVAGQKYYNPLMRTDKKYKLYPGDIKFEDLNDNGYIDRGKNTVDDPGDRRIIGNTEPRYIYSFTLSGDWNNFFASVFLQGVGKQDWYPTDESATLWGQYNRPYAQLPKWQIGNYWTEDNTDAYLPRYTGYYAPFYKGSSCANTRYLQNVAYIRMKNVQFGYNLPEKWINRIGLTKVSIFFSGENLWTWSPLYKHTRDIDVTANIYGYDSEATTTGDGYNYPTLKSYSLGLNITF